MFVIVEIPEASWEESTDRIGMMAELVRRAFGALGMKPKTFDDRDYFEHVSRCEGPRPHDAYRSYCATVQDDPRGKDDSGRKGELLCVLEWSDEMFCVA